MPIWISQDTVTADTPRNHSRTAWLDPLQDRIQAAIRAYVQRSPGGETVTLAVFDAIPPADVARLLPRGRNIDAGRRELGLRVPLELISLYGAHRVETLRRDDGRTASPRRTGKDWPRNYTPHRVTAVQPTARQAQTIELRGAMPDEALWQDLLVAWLSVLTDYRAAADDLGWWHSASASLSLLSGAIWRLPGAVCRSGFRMPGHHSGRDDRGELWLSHRGSTADLSVQLAWPDAPQVAEAALTRALQSAAWRLSDVPHAHRAPARYAVALVVPALTGSGRTVEEAAAIMDAAWQTTPGPAAMARLLAWDDPLALSAHSRRTCPGVMLVAQPV